MKLFSRTLILITAALFTVYMVGCGSDEDADTAALFMNATPADGEIEANGSITVTFDKTPANIKASAGKKVTVSGQIVTIEGPFTPGELELTLTWENGEQTLKYTVLDGDIDRPEVIGGTIRNGDDAVESKQINADGRIEIEFDEDVTGQVALQTAAGEPLGWFGKVEGTKAILEFIDGEELDTGTNYVIKGRVTDADGNAASFTINFLTAGPPRSPFIVTDISFNRLVLKSELPVVVEFGAVW